MKYILLFTLLFLVSGCSVNYNLTVDENYNFIENVSFQAENQEESVSIQENSWPVKVHYDDPEIGENPEKIEGVEYYQDSILLQNGFYQRNLNYSHSISSFRQSHLINSCYEHFYVNESNSSITLSTSSKFLCMEEFPELSNVRVSVTLSQPVLSSNADEVSGNQYIWNINSMNFNQRGLILSFSKIDNSPSKEEKPHEKNSSSMMIMGILFFFFFLFLLFIFVYNYKKRNHS